MSFVHFLTKFKRGLLGIGLAGMGLTCARVNVPPTAAYVYVSQALGNDGNPGTSQQPKKTIAAGVAAAQRLGAQVLVGKGDYEEMLPLVNGVSVSGGYDPENAWSQSEANKVVIRNPLVADQPSIAARGEHIIEPTELSYLTLEAAEGQTWVNPGQSTYGLYCNHCPALVMHHMNIKADKGTDGVSGALGVKGADGLPGEPGITPACETTPVMAGEKPGALGGTGGINPSQPLLNGGAGGQGANTVSGGKGKQGDASPAMELGGEGGKSGDGVAAAVRGTDGKFSMTIATPGMPASQAAQGGQIKAGYWEGKQGEPGNKGDDGMGGGGGGGGGAYVRYNQRPGAGGGGAGAGGAGGQGGTGGMAGGGSFGVFVLDSIGMRIRNSHIQSDNGGAGGLGGEGGAGGTGGVGGKGGVGDCMFTSIVSVGYGGDGGKGTDGAKGGDGGGGAGGPSYAVYAKNTGDVAELLDAESMNNLQPGKGGQGGLGGGKDPNRAVSGIPGEALSIKSE